MIKIENLATGEDHHFVVTSDRPMRVEVTVSPTGHVLAHGYLGAKVVADQEPDVVYDSDNEDNPSFARHGRRDAGFEAVELPDG